MESAGATPLQKLKFIDSLVVTVPNDVVAGKLGYVDGVVSVSIDAVSHGSAATLQSVAILQGCGSVVSLAGANPPQGCRSCRS